VACLSGKVAKILAWFLLPNEGGQERNIIVDSDKTVKGGMFPTLVESGV